MDSIRPRPPPRTVYDFFLDAGLSPPAHSDPLQLCTIALGWQGARDIWGHLKRKDPVILRDPMVDERPTTPSESSTPEARGRVTLAASLVTALKVLPYFVSTPGHPMKHQYWANICTQPQLIREGFNRGMDIVIQFLRDQLAAAGAAPEPADPVECRSRCKVVGGGCPTSAHLTADQLWRLETLDAKTTSDCISLAKATEEHELGLFTLTLRHQDGQWTVVVSSTPYLDHFLLAKTLSVDHFRVLLRAAIKAKRKVDKAPRQQIAWPKDFDLDPEWLSRKQYDTGHEGSNAESEALKQMLWPDHRSCLETRLPLVSVLEDKPWHSHRRNRRGSKRDCKDEPTHSSEGLPEAASSGPTHEVANRTSTPTPPDDPQARTRTSTPKPPEDAKY
ncbi:unnamed protein product [Parajaminaea phylloscopi]